MKLYYAPGACSLAPHIVLREAGIAFDLGKVDFATRTADGGDYRAINPKGSVPALRLDDGQVLTEVAVILQYLADRKPEAGLAPANGTFERVRLQEWLNYIASEVHKGFGPLFNPKVPDDAKAVLAEALGPKFDYLSKLLADRPFLAGERYTVADAYLFVILNWTGYVKIDLARWPVLAAFQARVAARPAVQAALKAEGLAK